MEHAKEKLARCIQALKAWMFTSNPKLNDSKSKFIVFVSKHQQVELGKIDLKVGQQSKMFATWEHISTLG